MLRPPSFSVQEEGGEGKSRGAVPGLLRGVVILDYFPLAEVIEPQGNSQNIGRCQLSKIGLHLASAERAFTDLRAVTPLIWEHVNPYGRFKLDTETRLDLSPNGW